MSEALRGFVLLLSVVLWLPVLRPFLDGDMRTDEAVLRYAGALLLSWGGVSLLAAIIRAYTPEPKKEEPQPAPPAPRAPSAPQPASAPATDGNDDATGDASLDGEPRRRAQDLAR